VYHSPQDEFKPEWDFSGFVCWRGFTLDVARDVAQRRPIAELESRGRIHRAQEKRGA